MTKPRTLFTLIVSTLCFLWTIPAALAQGTNLGTIRGTVTDPNGAVVANAQVRVTDVETNISRDLTTDADGNYEAAALKSGNYRVAVTAAGFKTTVAEVVLQGSDIQRKDVKVEIGEQAETVTITAGEGQLIERDTPVISSTINNQQLIEVPRDSRDIYQFLYLNPDITQGPGGEGTFKFIGAQSYGAAFSLDGQRANGGIFGEPTQSQPSLETIGELRVLSKNFTAEYSGIANVRVETKRGTKDFHGSLFYNNKNQSLAAWSVQDKSAQAAFLPTPNTTSFPEPYLNLNETGGSLGGPVPFGRDKTFFLLSYERRWDLAPFQVRSGNIPTTPLLTGNFSGIANASKPAVPAQALALLTADELAANTVVVAGTRRFVTIPQRLLNPIAQNIMAYYPTANAATPFNATNGRLINYVQNINDLLTRDLSTLRVDHDFTDRDKFFAVYNYQVRSGNRNLVVNPLPDFGFLSQHQNNHTLSLSYTRLISDSIVNELRGGYNFQLRFVRANQTTRDFLIGVGFNQDEVSTIGSVLGAGVLDTGGHVAFTVSPFQNIGNGGRNTDRSLDQRQYTFGDTLTWTAGNHSLKFGADFVANQAEDGFSANRGNPRGLINYGANFNGYARFLLGLPPTTATYVGNTLRGALDVSNWENGFFAQDDWKIRPKLTLNLGLRYELITPFVERNDLMINFDPTASGNSGFKGRFIVPSEKTLAQLDQRFITYGVVTADQANVGRGLVQTDRNNLAPRFGLAWQITDRDVLRGGYGIFYPTSAAQGMRDSLATNAFNQGVVRRNTFGLPGGINPRGITPFSGGTIDQASTDFRSLAANAIPADLQAPRIEQYNATYEREVGWNTAVRVSYIGTRQRGLIAGRDLNMLEPNTTPFGVRTTTGALCDPIAGDCAVSLADAARRPFPSLGSFLATYGNVGNGRANSMQIEINRRFTRGLMFNFSYTLLDQESNALDVGASSLGGTLYNQFAPTQDFSRDSAISRHRVVSYGMFALPFGRSRSFGEDISRWADAAVGGWDLTWNLFAKSGTGFTPFWQCLNCGDIGPGNVGSAFIDAIGDFNQSGTYRPLVVGDPYGNLSGDQYFNRQAFGLPPIGADLLSNPAVAKRNSLQGPGTWGANLGVHKNFSIREGMALQVGADFNNVFNHPLFSPAGTIAQQFGRLGEFQISLDAAGNPVILPGNVFPNPDFGRNNISYTQEGIDNRRSVRIRLRFTF